MRIYRAILRKHLDGRGDTIVEVLIAIAIAAFAVGISYATAQRSLQQSITSREHNEALNILENQVANLQLRFNQTPDQNTFESQFGNSNSQHHFCLDDNSKNAADTNQWTPYFNGSITVNGPLASPPYADNAVHAACVRPSGGGATYYVDIETSASTASKSPTLYHLTVRWEKLGGGTNQVSLFYHLDGGSTVTLGASTTGPTGPTGGSNPPSCSPGQYYDIVLAMDTSSSMTANFDNDPTGGTKLNKEKSAADQIVQGLNPASPGNRVGAINFDSAAHLLVGLSTNSAALINAINGMNWQTGTNFSSALSMVTTVLNSGLPANHKVVIFMSDGEPSVGITNPNVLAATANAMKASGIIIYTLGMGVEDDPYAISIMQSLAGGSDARLSGYYTSVTNKAEFDSVAQQLASAISC